MIITRRKLLQAGAVLSISAKPEIGRTDSISLELSSKTKIDRVETFVAAEAFKIGNEIGGRVLTTIGWNFVEHFLKIIEKKVPDTQMYAWTLHYAADDRQLMETLGIESPDHASFLAQMHRLMALGDSGPCHLDGRSNFAYLRSPIDKGFWAAHWISSSANEWNVGAVQVPHPQLDWQANSRVFSSQVMHLSS